MGISGTVEHTEIYKDTLIRTIENEKIKFLGYNYTNALSPRHWI